MTDMPVGSAYIHIPFCERKCAYCDFVSYADRSNKKDGYVQAIIREIELTREDCSSAGPLSTLYFGGGTPTTFSPEQLSAIMDALRSCFGVDKDAEISLEMNPGTVDSLSLRQYRDIGFNRASIGVQSFSDGLLSLLGRIHNAEEAQATIFEARAAGFHNINCDLMLGLPGQTLDDALHSTNKLISLEIPHISFYSLSVEEGTAFYDRYHNHEEFLPSPDLERQMYHSMLELLKKHGYQHYEISNCAWPGYESRHNTVYWRALPYYGFGCGAHAYLKRKRIGKMRDLDRYIHIMNTGGSIRDIIEEDEYIDLSENQREFMLLGFRLTEGISEEEFLRRFGLPVRDVFGGELSDLLEKGLILFSGGHYFLSGKGLDFANEVFRSFVS
jgi:oxygen-independent coproporphyrinogen-3 oxidase